MADVVGKLEASTIFTKDQDPFDASSGLWRRMWGSYHLDYVIDHLLERHTDDELQALIGELEASARVSSKHVIEFLRVLAERADVLDTLNVRSKDEVLAAAADLGLAFDDAEFDSLIWDLEMNLARKRGESFDAHFPLWETMWGKYYLEYLVTDLLPSLSDADVNEALATQAAAA